MNSQFLQVIGTQIGIAVGALFVLLFVWMIMTKLRMHGRIYCYFLEPTNYLSGELLKVPEKAPVATLTSKVDGMSYAIDVNKQRMVTYPAGLPAFMQETVMFQAYVRGQMHPVDLRDVSENHNPGNSAAILKSVKNQVFVSEMIDKMGAELGGTKMTTFQMIMIIALVVLGAGLGGVGYLSFQTYKAMEVIQQGIVGS